jgi:hypothetical protein
MENAMNTSTQSALRCTAGALAVSALAFGAQPAAAEAPAPVGIKLLVQPWTPLDDNDAVQPLYDSNDAITASINRTWDKVKPKVIDSIRARLQTPDLFAEGVSLYDLKINVNTPELSIAPDGNAGFIAKLLVRDTYLETTATTPDIAFGIGLGSYADPRCSVRFSLELTLKLKVSDDKTRLLESNYGPNDTLVRVQGFKADSQNTVCDIGKFLAKDAAKLFLGRDLWQWMTDEINNPKRPEYIALNNSIKQELNGALGSINAQARAPAEYARLRVWARDNKLTVLFGVRELPLPARVASARGRLTVGDLKGVNLPITNCDQLHITAMVKTGPRPLLDPDGVQLGDAPMVAVGRLHGAALAAPAAGQACDYVVDQLVPGFPNLIKFDLGQAIASKRDSRHPTIAYKLSVRPDGWNYDRALHPQPSVTGLNLTLLADNIGASGYLDKAATTRYVEKGDPSFNPAGHVGTGVLTPRAQGGVVIDQGRAATALGAAVAAGRTPALGSGTATLAAPSALGGTARSATAMRPAVTPQTQPIKNADAAALNPQPLPPDPPEAGTTLKSLNATRVLAPR